MPARTPPPTPRAVDLFAIDVQDLARNYENLKKLPGENRVASRLMHYERTRRQLWRKIRSGYELIIAADPPEEFEKKFQSAEQINEKTKQVLMDFGFPGDQIEELPVRGAGEANNETASADNPEVTQQSVPSEQQEAARSSSINQQAAATPAAEQQASDTPLMDHHDAAVPSTDGKATEAANIPMEQNPIRAKAPPVIPNLVPMNQNPDPSLSQKSPPFLPNLPKPMSFTQTKTGAIPKKLPDEARNQQNFQTVENNLPRVATQNANFSNNNFATNNSQFVFPNLPQISPQNDNLNNNFEMNNARIHNNQQNFPQLQNNLHDINQTSNLSFAGAAQMPNGVTVAQQNEHFWLNNDGTTRDWNEIIEREVQSRMSQMGVQDADSRWDRLTEAVTALVESNTRANHGLKPKPFQVEKFRGDVLKYPAFKQALRRQLDSTNWGEVEKFLHVKQNTEGEAYSVLSRLHISDNVYEEAFELLDRNYNSPRRILAAVIQVIVDPSFKLDSNSNVESLKNFKITLDTAVSNVKLLNITVDQVLQQLVVSRFNESHLIRLEDYLGLQTEIPSLDQIQLFLTKELHSRSQIIANSEQNIKLRQLQNNNGNQYKAASTNQMSGNSFKGNSFKNHNNKFVGNYNFRKPAQANVHMTNHNNVNIANHNNANNANRRDGTRGCVICGAESHDVLQCAALARSANKKELMIHYRMCIYCGKHPFSPDNPCRLRNSIKCGICNGNHTSELCNKQTNTMMTITDYEPRKDTLLTLLSHHTEIPEWLSYDIGFPTLRASIMHPENTLKVETICLTDDCSSSSFITEEMVQILGLKKRSNYFNLNGIKGISSVANNWVVVRLVIPENGKEEYHAFEAIVLPKICGKFPARRLPALDVPELKLANPKFNIPSKIDLLLGNNVNYKLFNDHFEGKMIDGFKLVESKFGFIVSGCFKHEKIYRNALKAQKSSFLTVSENNQQVANDTALLENITKILGLHEDTTESAVADDKQEFEDWYLSTVSRVKDGEDKGRYIVKNYPARNPPTLQNSYDKTLFMQKAQARRKKSPEIEQMEHEFLVEYLQSGHMSPVPPSKCKDRSSNCFYMPHFSVIREESYTTKCRIVFNASSGKASKKPTVNYNDQLSEGPNLLPPLLELITGARIYKFMYTSDIAKAFRQILIHDSCKPFQRIIWIKNDIPCEYELNTLTYGLKSSPTLCIRTIQKCAQDNAKNEEIKNICCTKIYMDDLVASSDSIEKCQAQINDINDCMNEGKFPMLKWNSSDDKVLEQIPPEKRLNAVVSDEQDDVKLLGILYNKKEDSFKIKIPDFDPIEKWSKRIFCERAASLFDICFFLMPYLMALRMHLRELWKLSNTSWDTILSPEWSKKCQKCFENLEMLKQISIPRWIGAIPGAQVTLACFSDASANALGCCIYSKINGMVSLIASKGQLARQVASVKSEITIPKKECEAIVLLCDLLDVVLKSFKDFNVQIFAYTDSKCNVHWLRGNTVKDKFVLRRKERILKTLKPEQIHWCATGDNPSDPISRSLNVMELINHKLYFNGPEWLQGDQPLPVTTDPQVTTMMTETQRSDDDLFERISIFSRMVRVVSYIILWKTKASSKSRISSWITSAMISKAKVIIFRYYQRRYFGENLENIKKFKWVASLDPIVEPATNLVRVGGRLGNSKLPYEQRHPIIIIGRIKEILIRYVHLSELHLGHSATQTELQKYFWITGIKRSIYAVINKCPKCLRYRNQRIQPKMADLPAERVTQAEPFEVVGIDLAGFYLINPMTRSKTKMKCYILVSICFYTKAIALEIVTGLSTQHFLLAFDRLKSRRGLHRLVFCDNAGNFVGASKVFKSTYKQILNEAENILALQEVTFKRIPPFSPSRGGTWERAVGAAKYFLKRNLQLNANYEEFQTLLLKIESILNARPLLKNPINPTLEFPVLTPNHFLMCRGLQISSIEALRVFNIQSLPEKWKLMAKEVRILWGRFSTEYLASLQKRVKNRKNPEKELKIGEIVLIATPHQTIGEFNFGRVEELIPAKSDNIVRTVKVYSKGKTSIQSVFNLIPLNVLDEDLEGEDDHIRKKLALELPVAKIPENPPPEPVSSTKPEDKKVPRRSARLLAKSTLMLTMICFMLCPTKVTATVNKIAGGLQLEKLDQIYFDKGYFKTSINTGINSTYDLQRAKEISWKMSYSCTSHECAAGNQLIKISAQRTIETIENCLNAGSRQKRSWKSNAWKWVKNNPGKTASVAAAGLGLGVDITAHALHNSKLNSIQRELLEEQQKSQDLFERQLKLHFTTVNETQSQVNQLLSFQQQQDQKEARHQLVNTNLHILRLIEEKYTLLQTNSKIDEQFKNICIAQYGTNIDIQILSRQINSEGDFIIMHYEAEIGSNPISKVAIISIPDNSQKSCNFSNSHVGYLARDPLKNFLSWINRDEKILKNIKTPEKELNQQPPTCDRTLSISKENKAIELSPNKIYVEIYDPNWAVQCNASDQIYLKIGFYVIKDCQIIHGELTQGIQSLKMQIVSQYDDISSVEMTTSKLQLIDNQKASRERQEIEIAYLLRNSWQKATIKIADNNYKWPIATITLVLFAVILGAIIKCFYSRSSSRRRRRQREEIELNEFQLNNPTTRQSPSNHARNTILTLFCILFLAIPTNAETLDHVDWLVIGLTTSILINVSLIFTMLCYCCCMCYRSRRVNRTFLPGYHGPSSEEYLERTRDEIEMT